MLLDPVDLVLCGGGLQSSLIVAALYGHRAAPAAGPGSPRLAVLEAGRIGGNHTWSFYESDLSAAMLCCVAPRRAVLDMCAALGDATVCERTPVRALTPHRATLHDGRVLPAAVLLDARGAEPPPVECGYQKFYGEEITLRAPHALACPIVMDATVDQDDGFRFMYVLPLGARRILLEDTSFSDSAELDIDDRRSRIVAWMRSHGWHPQALERSEQGVLPMPLHAAAPPPDDGIIRGGYRGGWFHPGTGYSLPLAAELAELVELVATSSPAALPAAVARARRRRCRRARICLFLNRLLFRGYPPAGLSVRRWRGAA